MTKSEAKAKYPWLPPAGDLMYFDIDLGNQATARLSILENGGTATPVTVEQMEATVKALVSAISPMTFNPRGEYDPSAAYVKPDTVIGTDGNTYACKADKAVTGVDPVSDKSAWEILALRGETGATGAAGAAGAKGDPGQTAIANIIPMGYYNPNVTYSKDQSVIAADGNSYSCLADGTKGIDPTVSDSSWGLLVLRGAKGDKGDAGKDAPVASITAEALAPALAKEIADAAKLSAGSAEGSWGEIDTGKTFRGKKVYRQDFTLYVNASVNVTADLTLIATPNAVDHIISVGGDWKIGYGNETKCIPNNDNNQNTSEVLLFGDNGLLTFRSKANNARSGHLAIVIVEYTKK